MKYLTPVRQEPKDKNTLHKSAQIEVDMEFQRSLRALFVRSNQTKFDEIVKALEDRDIKLAHRLTHTLKGNAGQLGKFLLQQAAADVEHQLRGGENLVTEDQLETLEIELNAVMAEFTQLLKESSQIESSQELLDEKSSRELIEKLEPMLKMGNPECCKLINDIRRIHGSEALIYLMEDFEFKNAITVLAELKEKLMHS
jgi:HPt (histidine-containing phosphotransfer) domain-containing protein